MKTLKKGKINQIKDIKTKKNKIIMQQIFVFMKGIKRLKSVGILKQNKIHTQMLINSKLIKFCKHLAS